MTRLRRSGPRRAALLAGLLATAMAAACERGAQPVAGPPPGTDLASVMRHNNLGVALMDHGRFPEAAKEFSAALKAWEGDVTASVNLGLSLYYDKKTGAAVEALENALRADPENTRAHYALGLIHYYATANNEEAVRHFSVVAHRDPMDPWTQFYLGMSLMRAGRFDGAASALGRVVEMSPGHLSARYQLSLALRRLGRTDDAEKALATFTSLRSAASAESATPGVGYLEQGRYSEAAAETGPGSTGSAAFVPVDDPKILESLPAAAARGPLGLVTGDYDNDGLEDQLEIAGGRLVLKRRGEDGSLTDVTDRAGLGTDENAHGAAAAFADVDHDGDLDIYLTRDGGPNLLFRNTGRGDFIEVGRKAGVDGGNSRSADAVFVDLDDDRAIDACVANVDGPPLLFFNNRDGTFSERSAAAGLGAEKGAVSVAAGDVNADGYPDLLFSPSAGGGPEILLSERGRHFSPPVILPGEAAAAAVAASAQVCAFLDFDSDGDLDVVCAEEMGGRFSGPPSLWRNDLVAASGSHWLKVTARGRIHPQVLSNFSGIGARVEVRAAGLWLEREVEARTGEPYGGGGELRFGLGDVEQLDYVRVTYPSGVRMTREDVKADQAIVMDEPAGKYTSCPMIYAWDGARFAFITDTLGAAVLGEWEAPGRRLRPDPDEWVKIEGDRLAPKDGALLIRVTDQLEEADLIDTLRLVAVDHPADVEVYPDERLLTSTEAAAAAAGALDGLDTPRLHVVACARSLVRAEDERGRDLSDVLAEKDGRFHGDFDLLPWPGLAAPHDLTLDTGPLDGGDPILILDGWTEWGSSSSLIGAWQAGVVPLPMELKVPAAGGGWRTAIPDIGVPAGLPRTIVAPLKTAVDPDTRRLRLSTNLAVYWDRIRVGYEVASPARVTEAPLFRADLRWLGYPRLEAAAGGGRGSGGPAPQTYDYDDRDAAAEWGTIHGDYTRYGEVNELLARSDDNFVVMGPGEEIAITFDARRLPPIPAGWKRDFFLYAGGYGKDMDVNSALPFTVEPLPFRAMSGYPYGPGERFPVDAAHLRALFEWNTRRE